VPRGKVKYLRVCEEMASKLPRLSNGEYRQDCGDDFQNYYASPTHLVQGPYGWPTFVAKASLGLVPVEADGSASFNAPSGKVLYFVALDGDLNEIQRMRSVVQLQPGERRSCIGAMKIENRRRRPCRPWPCGGFPARSTLRPGEPIRFPTKKSFSRSGMRNA